jgi:catechol 2,3-dioxygenase-like lactoylglutathione lyase family enzyme
MAVKVEALDHLVINVADVAVTAEWYGKILGMEVKVFDPGGGKAPRTSLQFGNQKINVRPRDADKVEWFTADHQTAGSEDLCFLTSASPDERRDRRGPGSQARRPRHPALGLLQGSGW